MRQHGSAHCGIPAALALSVFALACSPLPEPTQSVANESVDAPQFCVERLAGEFQEISLEISGESGRTIPLTIFAPSAAGTYPLAAFSHGAFASPTRYRAMLGPLAGAGYVVIAPMHVDSEEFESAERPTQDMTWQTRNADMAFALNPSTSVLQALEAKGVQIDNKGKIALGHSYGALIAQLPAGAMAVDPDGDSVSRYDSSVDAVVAWSPPGPLPGMMEPQGWNSIQVPNLTITGTTDILPGFIDDWRLHLASFENAPVGQRAYWVGENIDHYFGGMFGREKLADEDSRRLFARALATSLQFMDRHADAGKVCTLAPAIKGETYKEG